MNRRPIGQLTMIASGTLALVAASHAAPERGKVPLPRPRPVIHQPLQVFSTAPLAILPSTFTAKPVPAVAALAYTRPSAPLPVTPSDNTPASDIEIVKRTADLVRRDRFGEATSLKSSISDPLARKLVEWMILRGAANHSPGFERYAAFISENPSWPSVGLLRKRAEAALWDDERDGATVLAYFATTPPRSPKGSFALARALAARGDARGAERHVREAWQNEPFSAAIEGMVLDLFPGMLRPADHRVRMHRRLYAEDNEGGLRSAQRVGGDDLAIAKAWSAVNRKSKDAKALLDAVPKGARHSPGYVFSLARWLRRNGKTVEAAHVLLNAPRDVAEILVPDEWWIERRLVSRALIEAGQHQTAYRVARDATSPDKSNYRVDHEFTAGWIALRFLKDAATASRHFANITARSPTALARAGYWQGRAAEARGQTGEARSRYAAAARFRTTYYGQLAHARLGETDVALPAHPAASREQRTVLSQIEIVRALAIVYAAGERELAIPIVADVADRTSDAGALAAMADITQQNRDARATLLIGKAALNQGLAFAHYAFPVIGVPGYKPIGPDVDPSLLYSIVRQESAFNPKTISIANAMGLMQVTPAAGRSIAKKFGVGYDQKRLLNDTVYNVQMGAAELGDLIRDYRGSYLLALVGYNAGRGRVRDWIARYGDPRDPKVDPVDWVEMIPFSETRNYVQRILENVQVYRARFGATRPLTIEADLRRGTAEN
ncbi:MAG: transglycosylase SLT domain-containing protein [Rhizobiales bacterium]|nr:transglycosylase SLT domain-containing protein [Hyphomicrobiales bacterium]